MKFINRKRLPVDSVIIAPIELVEIKHTGSFDRLNHRVYFAYSYSIFLKFWSLFASLTNVNDPFWSLFASLTKINDPFWSLLRR